MILKGLQKLSLIDYEPYTCCVIFTAGCNFRCHFCSNRDLVLCPETIPTIPLEEFYQFLTESKKWLDAVCICGGEPTIHKDLPEHIARIKDMGFKVKLDTNGSNPDVVQSLIDAKLIDYCAMDIKAPLSRYQDIISVPIDTNLIQRSVDLLMQNRIGYEFRTTVVPTLIDERDFEIIGPWLAGAEKYFLQQFSNKSCLKRALEQIGPYPLERIHEFKKIVEPYIKFVAVRS